MPRLIITSRVFGSEKKFMFGEINKHRNDIRIIKKYTTRKSCDAIYTGDETDLIYDCTMHEINQCDYNYRYHGCDYGINRVDIIQALNEGFNPFLTIASFPLISTISTHFPNTLGIFIHDALSGGDLINHFNRSEVLSFEERNKRRDERFREYVRFLEKNLFNYIVLNKFDSSFVEQLNHIFDYELSGRYESNYIFVIMSFKDEYNETYKAIKSSSNFTKGQRWTIERMDTIDGDYKITYEIECQIKKAALIICDISENSPNVFYELGFARALSKTIITIAKNNTLIPFDVYDRKTIFYSDSFDLQEKLIKELQNY